ncbi:MAG: hypothetical protein HY791_35975 [Deltaproteobacteria bacterium]|nr:hypothetical protein [Deltaproteobacteria bacterium]
MRPRHYVVVLLLLAGRPAFGLTLSLQGDLGYQLSHQWGLQELNESQLGWGLGLQTANGRTFNPGYLDWNASALYRTSHDGRVDGSTDLDALTFNASASLLRSTPASFRVGAQRVVSDFAEESGEIRVGATASTQLSGAFDLRVPKYPTLSAVVGRSLGRTRSLGGAETETAASTLTLGTHHGFGPHTFFATYATSWNDGSLAPSNYDAHNVSLGMKVGTSTGVSLHVASGYTARIPTVLSRENPSLEDSRFTASTSWRASERWNTSASYGYFRTLLDQAEVTSERLSHVFSFGGTHRTSRELTTSMLLGGSFSVDRAHQQSLRDATQSLGLGLGWTRQIDRTQLALGATGSAGVLEPSSGPVGLSWGTGGSASLFTGVGPFEGGATYAASVEEAARSHDAQHRLLVRSRLWLWSALLEANLGANDGSSESELSNVHSTSLTADAAGRWRGFALRGGLRYGVARSLLDPLTRLPSPSSQNTLARFAELSWSSALFRKVPVELAAHSVEVTQPDESIDLEHGLRVHLSVRLGELTFSLQERFGVGRRNRGPWRLVNSVYAALGRSLELL